MITRIVKLKIKVEALESFKNIFYDTKPLIDNFPGCGSTNLHVQAEDLTTVFTVSYWDDLNALEAYRQSELFRNTWSKVKPLFSAKAEAWSLNSWE